MGGDAVFWPGAPPGFVDAPVVVVPEVELPVVVVCAQTVRIGRFDMPGGRPMAVIAADRAEYPEASTQFPANQFVAAFNESTGFDPYPNNACSQAASVVG